MGQAGQPGHQGVGDGMGRTAPPPGQSHQTHQHGIALAFNRKTDRVRTAKGQQRCRGRHPGARLPKGHRLTDHHQTTAHIGQPRQQAQADRVLTDQMPPQPKQAVVRRRVSVLPQHGQQAGETGLKTFANAVQLIAPERRGVDQEQGLETESPTQGRHQQEPAPPHRLWSRATWRSRRSSSPRAGPGRQPAAIRSRAVCGA